MDELEAEVLPLLDPLLRALEMLAFVSRHLHPPDFADLMSSIGAPDEDLKSARANLSQWPERLSGIRGALDQTGDAALQAFAGLREALREPGTFAVPTARCVSYRRGWRRSTHCPAPFRR